MKNPKLLWLIITFLIIIIGILSYSLFKTKSASIADINSFEECAAAGYPILEIYPEQCNTPDGKNFVNNIPGQPREILPPQGGEGVACTMEARECPDGSFVGRTGPNCEFTPCSGEK
ncbi:MAG: hypothetical protein OEX81_00535 [Candidatus Pacebacteria bacterium]|nr:hypothetical protein [Candidatus Paceibacterota bacterium]